MHIASATYAIRVVGHLDDDWAASFGDLAMTQDVDGITDLTVTVAGQGQLHEVLAGLREAGVVLTELRAVAPVTPAVERPLQTERLTLRAATAEDADATWRFRRLEEVSEWLTGHPTDLETYRARFATPDRLSTTLVVVLGHDPAGPVIGDLMLRRSDAWAQSEIADRARGAEAEIGWVLDPCSTGHGYATEAVRELLRHCFEDLGLHRVTANCFLANDASWRLMERVGMRRELHTVRESLHRSRGWLDGLGYAILDDEWPPT
jgi:RimJ/RimL family protein N-acetyltransferase